MNAAISAAEISGNRFSSENEEKAQFGRLIYIGVELSVYIGNRPKFGQRSPSVSNLIFDPINLSKAPTATLMNYDGLILVETYPLQQLTDQCQLKVLGIVGTVSELLATTTLKEHGTIVIASENIVWLINALIAKLIS